MTVHLRLIFYGLIAFVPKSDKAGFTALVLDYEKVSAHAHGPRLYLVEGCYPNANEDDNPCKGVLEIKNLFPINGTDLSIVGLTYGGMSGLDLGKDEPIGFPDGSNYTSLNWIPQMERIEIGAGDASRGCLQPTPQKCPIAARFRIYGTGHAKACHFLHDDRYYLHGFDFASVGDTIRERAARAIADAIEVDFDVDNFITVRVMPLSGGGAVEYKIYPSKNDYIVLALTNQPTLPCKEEGIWRRCKKLNEPSMFEHFLSYYWLADSGLTATRHNRVPRRIPSAKSKVNLGVCEDVAEALGPVVPHNKAECDAVMFRASPDG